MSTSEGVEREWEGVGGRGSGREWEGGGEGVGGGGGLQHRSLCVSAHPIGRSLGPGSPVHSN